MGKKVQVSLSLEVLGSQIRIPKGLKQTTGNSGGEERLTLLEFRGHGR